MAILMSVAEVLSGMKNDLAGTVKFIFQPAEEGAPTGEEGGAKLFRRKVPSVFFYLGGMPENADPAKTAAHNTPDFFLMKAD